MTSSDRLNRLNADNMRNRSGVRSRPIRCSDRFQGKRASFTPVVVFSPVTAAPPSDCTTFVSVHTFFAFVFLCICDMHCHAHDSVLLRPRNSFEVRFRVSYRGPSVYWCKSALMKREVPNFIFLAPVEYISHHPIPYNRH